MVLGGVVGIAVALIIAIVAFFVPATSTLELRLSKCKRETAELRSRNDESERQLDKIDAEIAKSRIELVAIRERTKKKGKLRIRPVPHVKLNLQSSQ